MKVKKLLSSSLAAVIILGLSSMFASCGLIYEEPDTPSYPIEMKAEVHTESASLMSVCTKKSPMRVRAYEIGKDETQDCRFLFENNAYIDGDGNLRFIGPTFYWPCRNMRMVAYWPAKSKVETDAKGRVTSADCKLIGTIEETCREYTYKKLIMIPIDEFSGNK